VLETIGENLGLGGGREAICAPNLPDDSSFYLVDDDRRWKRVVCGEVRERLSFAPTGALLYVPHR
jgi:hypothetical protein